MKTAEEIRGYEYDWVACDETGHVAMFSTAGGGYAPKVFLADTDGYEKSGPPTTTASMAPNAPPPNSWKDLAERGIFSYDSDPNGGPYQLVGVPAAPAHVGELSVAVGDVAKRLVLRDIRFGHNQTITREHIVGC